MWSLLACAPPPEVAEPTTLPAVEDLPEQVDPPDPFVTFDRAPVRDLGGWLGVRRPELGRLFDRYVYGAPPALPEVAGTAEELRPGLVRLLLEGDGLRLDVALFLPDGVDRSPVLLGLNKCGNPSVTLDPLVPPTTSWAEDDCDPTAGFRADYWPIDEALARGVAVATVHQSDIAPDDPTQIDEALISTWSAGLSRVIDGLVASGLVGEIAVWGHSRRGKTALVTAARDERVRWVWAHQSGTYGAALSRHLEGETIGAITTLFPHWFTPDAAWFQGHETRLPIDQHLLIAMVAPRPVLITDGDADAWADPEGARQAVELAAPVWTELYGVDGPTWSLRPGGHDVRVEDWQRALDFGAATGW